MSRNQNRANYFYCVRVTDREIHKNIKKALDWVIDKKPEYEPFRYTNEMLHVTLCEVCLKTDEEVSSASKVLQDMAQNLQAIKPSSCLDITGISNFHEKVMYAKVEYEDDFRDMAKFVSAAAKKAGVMVVENHDFTPHMTILKVSGMKARQAKVENINPWLYVHLKDTPFGEQPVQSVHLCKMGHGRREDGFYITPSEVMLE